MRYLLTLTLTLLVVGCEIKGHFKSEPKKDIISISDDLKYDYEFLQPSPMEHFVWKPYIGEYYYSGPTSKISKWIKFTEEEINCGEIECIVFSEIPKDTLWVSRDRIFYYSDIPDQYQAKREEIEDKIKLSSKGDVIYSTSGCFHEPTEESKNCLIRNGYISEKGQDGQVLDFVDYEWKWVDPPEEIINSSTEFEVSGTLRIENYTCQDFFVMNSQDYNFSIKNGQLEARCKE